MNVADLIIRVLLDIGGIAFGIAAVIDIFQGW